MLFQYGILYLDFVTQKLQSQQMIIITLDEIPLPQNVISLNLVTLPEVTNRSQKSLEACMYNNKLLHSSTT